MPSRRAVAVGVIAAVLVAAGLVDRSAGRPGAAVFAHRRPFTMPVAAPASALSSTWFCAGGTARPDGAANVTVVVANASGEPRSGSLTWVPSEGEPVMVPLEVAPFGRIDARATNRVQASYVAAVVELDGGGVAVEHTVVGPDGSDAAPCSPAASDRWYLANGATTKDAVQLLSLFNPFPGDAVVDVSFATDQGQDAPEAVQGFVVPARSLRVVNLTEVIRRRAAVATTVNVRTGRVVVEGIQTFDGSEGRRGLGLTLAAPAATGEWHFPEGLVAEGVRERVHVYNPGERDAIAEVAFVLDDGAAPVEPLEITIPPHSAVAVDPAESGVPGGTGHSVTVRSLNGSPVVAERELVAGGDSSRQGYSSTLGAAMASPRWLLAAGEATDGVDEWVVVHNPGTAPVTLSVTVLAGGQRLVVEGLQELTLGAAGRVAVRLGERIERSPLPLVVEASGPVVVERDLYSTGRRGLSTAIGVPLPG